MRVLETVTEHRAVRYSKQLDYIVHKLYNPSNSGWPDRLFVNKHGFHFYIEFKRYGERPRKLQAYRHCTLRGHKCAVYVCDNFEYAKRILDENLDATRLSEACYQTTP